MLTFLKLLFIFIGGGGLCSIAFRQKFELALPVYLLASVFLIYFFGIFGNLLYGVYFVVIISAIGFLLVSYAFLRSSTREKALENIWTPGFCAFIFILMTVFVVNQYKILIEWDDFMQWGVMLKEMVRLNDFYCVPDSVLSLHKEYVPAMTVFEYFWCTIDGGFSEASAYRALQFFALTLLLPIFNFTTFKNKIHNLVLIIIIFLIPCATGINLYGNIYIDAALGVLLGYTLWFTINNKEISLYNGVGLFLSVSIAYLTKAVGLFAAISIIIYCLAHGIYITYSKAKSKKYELRSLLFRVSISAAAVLVSKISWDSYKIACNIVGGQSDYSQISIKDFFLTLVGQGTEYHTGVLRNFLTAIFSSSIITYPFSISFFQIFIICMTVSCVTWYLFRYSSHKNHLLSFAISLPFLSAAYAGILLVAYMFAFDEAHGLALGSYGRYMASYWLAIIIVMYMNFRIALFDKQKSASPELDALSKKVNKPLAAILCLILFAFSSLPRVYTQMIPVKRFVDNPAIEILLDNVDIYNDKVYLITQGSNGASYNSTKYYANPLKTNPAFTFSIGTPVNQNDFSTVNITVEEWEKWLIDGEYTYVYILGLAGHFVSEFGSLFGDEAPELGLYKINKDDGRVRLEMIAPFDPNKNVATDTWVGNTFYSDYTDIFKY